MRLFSLLAAVLMSVALIGCSEGCASDKVAAKAQSDTKASVERRLDQYVARHPEAQADIEAIKAVYPESGNVAAEQAAVDQARPYLNALADEFAAEGDPMKAQDVRDLLFTIDARLREFTPGGPGS